MLLVMTTNIATQHLPIHPIRDKTIIHTLKQLAKVAVSNSSDGLVNAISGIISKCYQNPCSVRIHSSSSFISREATKR